MFEANFVPHHLGTGRAAQDAEHPRKTGFRLRLHANSTNQGKKMLSRNPLKRTIRKCGVPIHWDSLVYRLTTCYANSLDYVSEAGRFVKRNLPNRPGSRNAELRMTY